MMELSELKAAAMRRGHTGYVALLGRPNTGKSTFLNTILECHIAAVSNKPQTTRRSMAGIYSDSESQIIFLDAPGVHPGHIAIDEAMDNSVRRVLDDADIVVCLVDPTRVPGPEDEMAAKLAAQYGKPTLVVLNKSDISTAEQRAASTAFYAQFIAGVTPVEMTANDRASAGRLVQQLKAMLPEDIFLYDPEEVTTAYERDIAAELIRETLLEQLRNEIPHSIAVTVNTWQTTPKGIDIAATLTLEREAHKPIIIGQGGKMIKSIRRNATRKITELCGGKRIELSLFIKIVPNWRKRKQFLKELKLADE